MNPTYTEQRLEDVCERAQALEKEHEKLTKERDTLLEEHDKLKAENDNLEHGFSIVVGDLQSCQNALETERKRSAAMCSPLQGLVDLLDDPTIRRGSVPLKYLKHYQAAKAALTTTAGSDYVPRAELDTMKLRAESAEGLHRVALSELEKLKAERQQQGFENLKIIHSFATAREKLDKLREVARLIAVVVESNHNWHTDYDDYGGYQKSELCEQNMAALAAAKQLGLVNESTHRE